MPTRLRKVARATQLRTCASACSHARAHTKYSHPHTRKQNDNCNNHRHNRRSISDSALLFCGKKRQKNRSNRGKFFNVGAIFVDHCGIIRNSCLRFSAWQNNRAKQYCATRRFGVCGVCYWCYSSGRFVCERSQTVRLEQREQSERTDREQDEKGGRDTTKRRSPCRERQAQRKCSTRARKTYNKVKNTKE